MSTGTDRDEQLRILVDERLITRTIFRYGHAIDYGDEHGFADCWTDDAMLFWPRTGWLEGKPAILQAFRSHTHAPDVFHKHFMVEPLVTIDNDHAEVVSMFARLDMYPYGPAIRGFGRYRDRLLRCDDGAWRSVERVAEIEAARPS